MEKEQGLDVETGIDVVGPGVGIGCLRDQDTAGRASIVLQNSSQGSRQPTVAKGVGEGYSVEDILVVPVSKTHQKTFWVQGNCSVSRHTRFCGPTQRLHSPLTFADGQWDQVCWRTRRGGFFTDLEGTSLKLDDGRPRRLLRPLR